MKRLILFLAALVSMYNAIAQPAFTKEDSLRGSLNAHRNWWNVLLYDITVQPDYLQKSIKGKTTIQYEITEKNYTPTMQIDLQQPLQIDSIFLGTSFKLSFQRQGNICLVQLPKQKKSTVNLITVYYHGIPKEAIQPPWQGGFIWTKDSLGRPWISVACEGLGASVWYPCKDHLSDEPDHGALLTVIVPDSLTAVGNGVLQNVQKLAPHTIAYTWKVKNPINNYDIIPYIGKYKNFKENYNGKKGNLNLTYWALDYHLNIAKAHWPYDVRRMLQSFENWFGPYPFYEDGYQLIEAPHLGMEHQSAVAYGNKFLNGYLGRDLSGTGWGLKWDFIIVHESGHEWFGNNITAKDIADMWIHEGFTTYSEILFTESFYGKKAGNEYAYGLRRNIRNDRPVIGQYGVNNEGSGDMYPKGANMLHTIRHSMNDDSLFHSILLELQKNFEHQTVSSKQIEDFISKQAKQDYSAVFNQYLRTTQIPTLEFYFEDKEKMKLNYRWNHCVANFNLPVILKNDSINCIVKLQPTTQWQSVFLTPQQASCWKVPVIESLYYIKVTEVAKP